MARIRIIDEWLRSPVASPVRARAVMVVADTWAEQKVLMRAYQACTDQSRPSIVLHGTPLAMGPAGVDPHGAWGVHVDEHRDGRAQQLREQLEIAARRLAGAKHHPPRLEDEESSFDRKATNQWSPGSPRDRHSQGGLPETPSEPTTGTYAATEAPDATRDLRTSVPVPEVHHVERQASVIPVMPAESPQAQMAPAQRPPAAPQVFTAHPDARTIMPFGGAPTAGAPPPPVLPQRRTPRGWSAPAAGTTGQQRAVTPAPTADGLGKVVGHTMPLGFRLTRAEREVLNRLGAGVALRAREVASIAHVEDGITWMDELMTKLANHGLDIVAPGDDADGEPTYILRH